MTITGTAAGVPFLAVPPASGSASAPTVVGWHLMDPPRTETAFASALPLDGLDAWRIYLGLPMCGSRLPEGGFDELMRLGHEDAVLNLFGPITTQAAAEFPAALAELRSRFDLAQGPIGVLGGSLGAAVAQLVIAGGDVEVDAAVLVGPVVQLATVVAANERRFGVTYAWSERSQEVARRLDFVARAGELKDVDVLIVVGEGDDPVILEPAAALRSAVDGTLVTVAGMEHALAEEPGVEPAPQMPAAAEVDRLVVRWFADRPRGQII
ncbi:alpha/beta hydrolase [Pseudonocardia sp. 73-21]|uniref:alpha/beta hydrolase family protein n=1 Tax=Pseudonocardia sp. 73-21 TaxID=1895809 RepID=UPI00096886F9|nr:alpha/beta hydrolase [Pseudonocardia sp. 73-21]OJY41446.1 MAG: alpha/beta hydrolase [Pseudonocardia sp. 73-21]